MAATSGKFLGSSALAAMLLYSAPGLAQEVGKDGDSARSAVGSAASDGDITGGAIVVTARKRSEQLIDVPLTIQALSSATLETNRIENSQSLIGTIPSLVTSSNFISPARDFVSLVIRGIGAQSAGQPSVPIFVDGVYMPALAFDIGFLDTERVEVLQGPQSTLFGRNAEGGALNIVLRRPDQEFRGKVAVSYDSFQTARAQASVSGPINDVLSASIATDVQHSAGYLKNDRIAIFNGDNPLLAKSVSADRYSSISGRVALRYRPNEDLDINLSVDGSNRVGLYGLPGVPRGLKKYVVRSEFQIDGKQPQYGGALTVNAALADGIDLTSITGYRHMYASLPYDFDGSIERGPNYNDIESRQRILSQELRLSTQPTSHVFALFGVYGFTERNGLKRDIQYRDIDAFGGGQILVNKQFHTIYSKGVSAFVDVAWKITDDLELDSGLRWAYDHVRNFVDLDFIVGIPGSPPILSVFESGVSARRHYTSLIPSVSLKYTVTPGVVTYARYAQGYRSGGFPAVPVTVVATLPFGPEKTYNYEAGIKANLLGSKLRFDAAAFLIDLKDQQLQTLAYLNGDPNIPLQAVANAGSSRSKGFSLTAFAQPVRGVELNGSLSYTRARYINYIDVAGTDRGGERFPYVPEWTASAGATYTHAIASDTDLQLNANYKYLSSYTSGSGVDLDVAFPIRSYDLVGLRVSLIRPRWKIDAYVDNLFDKFIETRAFQSFFISPVRQYSVVLPPRMIGARLTMKLGHGSS